MKKAMLVAVASALLSIIPIERSHALDMYLYIPGVSGEVTTTPHANWIKVLSASWGHATKMPFEALTVTKSVDLSSPTLALAAADGRYYPSAVLDFQEYINSVPYVILKVTLTDVTVKSYAASGAGGLSDSVKLGFAKIEWVYEKRNPNGSVAARPRAGWDVLNSKAF